MAQATFSVRMDENLKQQFDMLCSDFGMSISTAITVFAKAVVREKRIPFEISVKQSDVRREDALRAFQDIRQSASANGLMNMTLDEINSEIRKSRDDK